MNIQAKAIYDGIRSHIETMTGALNDSDYVEVLGELSADIHGMIDAKNEEMGPE